MSRAALQANGQAIQHYRARRGLTQEELANKARYSKRQIERLEAGNNTTAATLIDLARVLQCRPDELLKTQDVNPSSVMAQVNTWLEERIQQKLLMPDFRAARLSDLIVDKRVPRAVAITCKSKSRHWDFSLRPEVTVVQLANALYKEHASEICSQFEKKGLEFFSGLYFCDADGDRYDDWLTVAELQDRQIDVLYIYVSISTMLATAAPAHAGIFRRARRAQAGGYRFLRARCRFYVWLFNRPRFSQSVPPRLVFGDLHGLAEAYAEANIHTAFSLDLVALMQRSPYSDPHSRPEKEEAYAYFQSTIAWTWHRAGLSRAAYDALISEFVVSEDPRGIWNTTRMYRLYFICRKVGDDRSAETLRRWFMAQIPDKGYFGDTELECERVIADNDSLLPHIAPPSPLELWINRAANLFWLLVFGAIGALSYLICRDSYESGGLRKMLSVLLGVGLVCATFVALLVLMGFLVNRGVRKRGEKFWMMRVAKFSLLLAVVGCPLFFLRAVFEKSVDLHKVLPLLLGPGFYCVVWLALSVVTRKKRRPEQGKKIQ